MASRAMSSLCQVRPIFVVIDVMIWALEDSKRHGEWEWPETRVLVLTNLTDDETRRSALLNGADSFITKRDLAPRLLDAIKDTIQPRS